MDHIFLPAFRLFVGATLLTGIVYPCIVLVIGQTVFPWSANGSPVTHANGIKGSHHVGIQWTSASYVHGRPSACRYGTSPSYASNVAVTSAAFRDSLKQRCSRRAVLDAVTQADVAEDMITASASGLDPHISPKAARQQIMRILQVRGWPEEARDHIDSLILACTETSPFKAVGDSAVNVSALNHLLDALNARYKQSMNAKQAH